MEYSVTFGYCDRNATYEERKEAFLKCPIFKNEAIRNPLYKRIKRLFTKKVIR